MYFLNDKQRFTALKTTYPMISSIRKKDEDRKNIFSITFDGRCKEEEMSPSC